jgi:hypothetical protein
MVHFTELPLLPRRARCCYGIRRNRIVNVSFSPLYVHGPESSRVSRWVAAVRDDSDLLEAHFRKMARTVPRGIVLSRALANFFLLLAKQYCA